MNWKTTKKRIASGLLTAVLLAAPFVSSGISSRVYQKMDASAWTFRTIFGDEYEIPDWYWKEVFGGGSSAPSTVKDRCPDTSPYRGTSGTRVTPSCCAASFNDHTSGKKVYDHCYMYKSLYDHQIKLWNNAGQSNYKAAKCGKRATTSIRCSWKTGTSKIKVQYSIDTNDEFRFKSKKMKLTALDGYY